jgi:anthranilate synthase component 1
VLRLYPDRLTVERFDESGQPVAAPETAVGEPLAELRQRVERVRAERGELPFAGGFVGWFGWDLVRLLERLPNRPPDPFGLPLAVLARFDTVVVFDHARQRVIALANEIEGEVDASTAAARLDRLAALLQRPAETAARELPRDPLQPAPVGRPSLSDEEYRAGVVRAKEHIAAGDIFQVVPSQRVELDTGAHPFNVYRALRTVNPSPFMFYLQLAGEQVIGASPEALIRLDNGVLTTHPIAGTRRRGADEAEDQRLEADLLADEKERAEHVMLVDLARNDIGRVARPGTVKVPVLMRTERFSHVIHLVSHVTGELRDEMNGVDALRACFPAGTVSGAPKIRAMEIIAELEPTRRGVYCGSIGYLSATGAMDTSIVIRTFVATDGELYFQAGGGIVADSDPELEYRETLDKVAGLLGVLAE